MIGKGFLHLTRNVFCIYMDFFFFSVFVERGLKELECIFVPTDLFIFLKGREGRMRRLKVNGPFSTFRLSILSSNQYGVVRHKDNL